MTKKIQIGNSIINKHSPTYFIADIASNHDGSLTKVKELIYMCAEAGSNAAKFQNFTGETLIYDKAFKKIGNVAHQSSWTDRLSIVIIK
jgi:N-acetylneuraminate synthase